MSTEKIDLGPPMVIGAIMLAVGLSLSVIAVFWCLRWFYRWARDALKDGGWN